MSQTISFNEFQKIEMCTGKVKKAEAVPAADKLLKLEVDVGSDVRQIVAGVAKSYTPEELVGKNIVVVTNLEPRKVRGVESHGMLLAAVDGETPIIISPDKPTKPGLKVM